MTQQRKKLIEVALLLGAITKASARAVAFARLDDPQLICAAALRRG